MQRLEILLGHRLDRHETHCRTAGRIKDRLGIHGIVLRAANERLDEAWMDQAHLKACFLEAPAPIVRARASLHSNAGRRKFVDRREQSGAIDLPRQNVAVTAHPMNMERPLAKIDGHEFECHIHLRQLATYRGREAGGVHSIT